METFALKVVAFPAKELPPHLQQAIILANQTFGWKKEQTQADFDNEYAYYYVALYGKYLVGYVGLHCILETATINQLFVHEAYRRQGVGLQLLHFVCEQLSHHEVDQLFLEVRVSNVAACQLYEKAGFQTVTIRKNYYQHPQEDAIIMHYLLEKRS